MGQEFCNGCQDCTNFKDFENNFSYFSNQPIKHLNNPSYENGNLDNSIFNIKTEYPSDVSILTNKNDNENNQKNDVHKNFSFSSKQISNESGFNQSFNINNHPKEKEKNGNIFIENQYNKDISNNILNDINLKENKYPDNFIKDDKEYNKINSNYFNEFNNFDNNEEKQNKSNMFNEEDKKLLGNIIINQKSKKITRLFKKLMEKKNISHQTLFSEYSSINDYQNY